MDMDMVDDVSGIGNEARRQVHVRFVTRQQFPFQPPPSSIVIPSNLTRMCLSAVLNNLVKAGNPDWDHESFDFMIDGELVRKSLEQYLLAEGISAEKILEIEYVKAKAPRKKEPGLHASEVTAVDGSNPSCVATGCLDGLGRIWKGGKLCTHLLEGHTHAINSVRIISPEENDENMHLATASNDHTLMLWKLNAEEILGHPMKVRPMKVRPYRILCGHDSTVNSVAAHPSRNMVCSGSWDCTIKLWQTNQFDADDSLPIKKRKVDDELKESLPVGEAVSTFVGHTQCVSSVVWPEHATIYSASWDNSIKIWDVESGKDLLNFFCQQVFNCIDVGGESSALIASGSPNPTLRIWDPRKPGTPARTFPYSPHASWMTACKWHGKSSFHVLSSYVKGNVVLWDLRIARPLAVIDSQKVKVSCVDWWKGDTVISGGEDSKLCISSDFSIILEKEGKHSKKEPTCTKLPNGLVARPC